MSQIPAEKMSPKQLARYIDQSVLKPEFTDEDIRRYTREAVEFGCKTACVNPASLPIAQELTRSTETEICVVCDFPFGLSTSDEKKRMAAAYAAMEGVTELDIVANYGWIRSGRWDDVKNEIRGVVDVCHHENVIVKTIMETDALTREQVLKTCDVLIEAGSDFVKTSTGFYTGGPVVGAEIELMRAILEHVKGRCKVKASGCVRTREHFLSLINMGVDRLGIGFRSTPVVLGLQK